MSSSSVVRVDGSPVSLISDPEFDTPPTQKSPLERFNPFAPEATTWDPNQQCLFPSPKKMFFGAGLARKCLRCTRIRERDLNQKFLQWEMEQYEEWLKKQ